VRDKLVDELRMWPGSPGLIDAAARAADRIEELERALRNMCELARQFCYDGEDSASMEKAEKLPFVQEARAILSAAPERQ
jgi:23S rRNA A2030 N6-methylase RlmJ